MSAGNGGRGPVPKPPDQRARGKRSDPSPLHILAVKPDPQPILPKLVGFTWHEQTIHWWENWRMSPLSTNYTDVDWAYMLETAYLHSEFWNGNLGLAGELRLRAQKFGETPEDRARLRIQIVSADIAEAEAEAKVNVPSSRARYSAPKAG